MRAPLIICDPSPEADATRHGGKATAEAIDLLPTFVEFAGGKAQPHRLEGRSLLPLLHGAPDVAWREYVVSEIDFSDRDAMNLLDLPPELCRVFMLRTARWKYILHETFRPQLFDLQNDPDEFVDLGDDPDYQSIRSELHEQLFTWLRRRGLRVTVPLDGIRDNRWQNKRRNWDPDWLHRKQYKARHRAHRVARRAGESGEKEEICFVSSPCSRETSLCSVYLN